MPTRIESTNSNRLRLAFVSTAVSPYCVAPRRVIDKDARLLTRHLFARRLEPGRQWSVGALPDTFVIASGFTLQARKRFVYVPTGLVRELRRFRPDVIVSEQLGTVLLFTLLYAIPGRVPVILRWEGTPHTERQYDGWFRRLLRRALGSQVVGFLCYSAGSEDYLRSLRLRQPARRIPYSVDDNMFRPPPPDTRRNCRAFLFVGQIIPRKGLHLLLPAFYRVVDIYPDAELWVVGDGIQRNDLEASVPTRYAQNVKWLGFHPPAEVAHLMCQAGNFVCPTLEDHGPVVQIEAAKTGLPIITTPFSGNAELVVRHSVNGQIVDPRDTNQLVAAMRWLIEHPDRQALYENTLKLASTQGLDDEAERTVRGVVDILRNIKKR